jgi:hypothetical protein
MTKLIEKYSNKKEFPVPIGEAETEYAVDSII